MLTSYLFGAHLSETLHVLGQVLMQNLLPDASWVEGLKDAVQFLRVLDPPPATHHS